MLSVIDHCLQTVIYLERREEAQSKVGDGEFEYMGRSGNTQREAEFLSSALLLSIRHSMIKNGCSVNRAM